MAFVLTLVIAIPLVLMKPGPLALPAHAEGAGPLRARSWVLDPVALQSVSVGVPLGADHREIGGVEVPLPEAAEQLRAEAAAAVAEDPESGMGALLQGDLTMATLQLPPGTDEVAAVGSGGLVRGIPQTLRVPVPGAQMPSRAASALAKALTAEAETVAFPVVATMVLSPEGELAASWGTGQESSAAVCVDAATGEQGIALEDPDDPTVLRCG